MRTASTCVRSPSPRGTPAWGRGRLRPATPARSGSPPRGRTSTAPPGWRTGPRFVRAGRHRSLADRNPVRPVRLPGSLQKRHLVGGRRNLQVDAEAALQGQRLPVLVQAGVDRGGAGHLPLGVLAVGGDGGDVHRRGPEPCPAGVPVEGGADVLPLPLPPRVIRLPAPPPRRPPPSEPRTR